MKLAPRSKSYRKAEEEASMARGAFLRSVDQAKARLAPVRLKEDLVRQLRQTTNNVRQEAAETARKHPFIIGGVAAAVTGWIMRRPLMALSRKVGVSIRRAWDARKNRETSDE